MASRQTAPPDQVLVRRIIGLRGLVQGLGIRPAVACLADSLQLVGSVQNELDGVRIDVLGHEAAMAEFLQRLPQVLPSPCGIEVSDEAVPESHPRSFRILASQEEGAVRTMVPVDRVTCALCLAEARTPTNRRFAYPFISCTACGPRYSILESMPYDRERTSMSSYAMCDACRAEYEDPTDRRFHSQTNGCPACGPRLWSVGGARNQSLEGIEAMQMAVEVLRQGGIVSLKGIGGYQLICDATNEAGIERLRTAKHRPRKPVALMVGNLAEANELVSLSPLERAALEDAAGPIVLARARPDSRFADCFSRSIHPGLGDLGVMLPTTALHSWLCGELKQPLVVTSGNREGEPLVYEASEAENRLSDIADLHLHHDRAIVRPIDDSVVRRIGDRIVTLRAGRGLAPMVIPAAVRVPAIAAGGHQKVAIAISNGHQAVLGPHIGDLDHEAARTRYVQQAESLCRLYRCEPERRVHDLHPQFFSTQWMQRGRELDSSSDPTETMGPVEEDRESLIAVQHHHAHVVAGMAEHGWLDRTVLGIAMDGTGFGLDGTIWGGELLRVCRTECDRLAHLRPFRLPGGEAAIREPSRVAIALIADALDEEAVAAGNPFGLEFPLVSQVLRVLSKAAWSPITTSAGRLFDGVAAIVLNDPRCSYEGELAMRLEAICDENDQGEYSFSVDEQTPWQLDWRPMIRQLVADRRNRVAASAMAMRFHRGLARAIVSACERFADLPVVFSGGVFQNRVLVELVAEMMPSGRELAFPGRVPPNDGGLAAGQLATLQAANPRRN